MNRLAQLVVVLATTSVLVVPVANAADGTVDAPSTLICPTEGNYGNIADPGNQHLSCYFLTVGGRIQGLTSAGWDAVAASGGAIAFPDTSSTGVQITDIPAFFGVNNNGDHPITRIVKWPAYLRVIGTSAFDSNPITELPGSWPESLQDIQKAAFKNTNLTSVPSWPRNLLNLPSDVFFNAPITEVSGAPIADGQGGQFGSAPLTKVTVGTSWAKNSWPYTRTDKQYFQMDNPNLTSIPLGSLPADGSPLRQASSLPEGQYANYGPEVTYPNTPDHPQYVAQQREVTVQPNVPAWFNLKGMEPRFSLEWDSNRLSGLQRPMVAGEHESPTSEVSINPTTGAVTFRPTAATPIGLHSYRVLVHFLGPSGTYEDGAINYLPTVSFNVDYERKLTSYPSVPVDVRQGTSSVVAAPSNAHEGEIFSRTPDTQPWVTVNSNGQLVVAPDANVAPGLYSIPVKVDYPDSDQSVISARINVVRTPIAEQSNPTWVKKDATQGQVITVPVSGAPANTRFSSVAETPSWVRVKDDGILEITPPYDNEVQGNQNIPIRAYYSDGSVEQLVAIVNVLSADRNITYGTTKTTVAQSLQTTINPPLGVPQGTTIKAADGVPTWATVLSNGAIVLRPDFTVLPGEYEIPVVYLFRDGSSAQAVATVQVIAGVPQELPEYRTGYEVRQGKAVTVESPSKLPPGATINPVIYGAETTPAWVHVDPSGVLTVRPGYDVVPQAYQIPLLVRTQGNGEATIYAHVKVNPLTLTFGDSRVAYQGVRTRIERPVDTPEFSQASLDKSVPSWVGLDDYGAVIASPSKDVEPGEYSIRVFYQPPAGTPVPAVLRIQVLEAPGYGLAPVDVTASNGIIGTPSGLPEGAYIDRNALTPDWVEVREDSTLKVDTSRLTEGKITAFSVDLVLADGSRIAQDVRVVVPKQGMNWWEYLLLPFQWLFKPFTWLLSKIGINAGSS